MSEEREFTELLTRHFAFIRPLAPLEVDGLFRHYQLLVRWNSVLNLTSIRRLEDVVIRHYCESLFLSIYLPETPVSVLDVGSGAGFPAIPMAILRPDCQFTLAESRQRKAVFLREAVRDYSHVKVEACRAEEVPGSFDWAVSRAVRWEHIVALPHRCIGLLLGERDAAAVSSTAGFDWQPPVHLPWGRHRVLVCGTRHTSEG